MRLSSSLRLPLLAATAALAACAGDPTGAGTDGTPRPRPDGTVGSVAMWPTRLEVAPGTTGRLTLAVRDPQGALMTGLPVLASTNDGVISVDANGNVRAVGVGTATLSAVAGGVVATTPVTVLNRPASSFDIVVRFIGTPSQRLADVATRAAARWERVITGDLTNVAMNAAAGDCGDGTPALNETVDDIVIFVRIDSIDGPNQVLGSAGPCYLRNSSALPIVGSIDLDSADVSAMLASGTADDVMTHEMGHVLGIGVLWNVDGKRTLLNGEGTSNPLFTGSAARTAAFGLGFLAASTLDIPVENTGGAGTADGHWRETTFGRELMTGFVNAAPNPMSTMTVRSLADMGYVVTETGADIFGPVTRTNVMGVRSSHDIESPRERKTDKVKWPIGMVDASGKVTPIRWGSR